MTTDLGFKGAVPGAWKVPISFKLTNHVSSERIDMILPNLAFFIPDALSEQDCQLLRDLFAQQSRAPVAVSGYQTANPDDIGSHRATGWGPELSAQLWEKIAGWFGSIPSFNMNSFIPTDWFGIPGKRREHKRWTESGISPVLRFMEYTSGGKHNTHYDMCYDYEAHDPNDRRRTLLSIVWYLNEEPNSGGATRFIQDNQDHLPIQERNLDDWTRSARKDEVLARREPHKGGALLFWHRMAHDVEEFTGSSRIIIRGDIEFTALDRS